MNNKTLILGTAMWGWSIDRFGCFKLLDYYYEKGFREVDTATNYPINKNKTYFRYAENAIQEWIKTNGVDDLKVIVKIGSISNDGSSNNNLTKSFLLMSYDYYFDKFRENFNNFMIHWDNRDSEDDVKESLEAMKIISKKQNGVGISEIRHPAIYARIPDYLELNVTIEFKHNIVSSALHHYRLFKRKSRFIVYGINMGGIKLFNEEYREDSSARIRGVNLSLIDDFKTKLLRIIDFSKETFDYEVKTLNHLNMIYAYNTPDISGIIIGPSKIEQLKDSIDYYEQLKRKDSIVLYTKIKNISDEIKIMLNKN